MKKTQPSKNELFEDNREEGESKEMCAKKANED
jgi:hypothetical protein